ncbi:MAG: hypothetical protein KJO06_09630 [Gemmatimonadetes bacterium]|nr:hypothetical protein [Gemmatimonadota bacterium]
MKKHEDSRRSRSSGKHAWLAALLMAVLALPLVAPAANAQEASDASSRSLNGHRFIPSARLFDPFIVTYVRNNTGVGSAMDVVSRVEDLEGGTVELVGDVTFLGIGFGYQQRLADWVAAYIDVGGGGRFGTAVESIVSTGLNAYVDFALGAKFRLWHNQRFYLSANLDYANTGVSSVNVLNWVRTVVDSGDLTDSTLVTSGSTGSARAGLNLAYSPAPWLGLTGVTLFGLGNAVGDLDSEFAFEGSIAADIDFGAISKVPIGLLLAFNSNSFTQQGGDITTSIDSFIWGIFYTGRDDFSIGLEFQNAKLPLRGEEESIRSSEMSINLRYWF